MGFFILYIISGVVIGLFTSHLAESKGYSSGAWFVLGFLFSLIALLVMVGMPKAQDNPAHQKQLSIAPVVLTEKDKRQNVLTWIILSIVILVGILLAFSSMMHH